MAHILSTGARAVLAGSKGLKEAFDEFVVDIYSGTAPATADAAATGTKLARLTKDAGAVSLNEASTRQVADIVVTNGSTNDTIVLTFTTPLKTLTYTQVAGDSTDDIIAQSVADAVNADTTLNLVVRASAIKGAAVTESIVHLEAIYPGEPFVLTESATGGCSAVMTATVANSRCDCCHWGTPDVATGYISLETAYDCEGVGLADGTATYYRIVRSSDDGTLSTTAVRAQGNIATSGGELNFSGSTTVATSAPIKITNITLTPRVSVV